MAATTLEDTLFAALTALCANVYPDVAPDGVSTPYIVIHHLAAAPLQYADNTLPADRRANVQLNVWHESAAQCITLLSSVEAALVAHSVLQARVLNTPVSEYDPTTKRRARKQDFEVWAPR